MAEIHPNFKAGYENMLKIASTKRGKKIYGKAVGKAKSKALRNMKQGGQFKGNLDKGLKDVEK